MKLELSSFTKNTTTLQTVKILMEDQLKSISELIQAGYRLMADTSKDDLLRAKQELMLQRLSVKIKMMELQVTFSLSKLFKTSAHM